MIGELNEDLSTIQQNWNWRKMISHRLGMFDTIKFQKSLNNKFHVFHANHELTWFFFRRLRTLVIFPNERPNWTISNSLASIFLKCTRRRFSKNYPNQFTELTNTWWWTFFDSSLETTNATSIFSISNSIDTFLASLLSPFWWLWLRLLLLLLFAVDVLFVLLFISSSLVGTASIFVGGDDVGRSFERRR